MVLIPTSFMASASTSLSISASITPMDMSLSLGARAFRKVVFPPPGEDIRFNRKVFFSFSSPLSFSASLSLS